MEHNKGYLWHAIRSGDSIRVLLRVYSDSNPQQCLAPRTTVTQASFYKAVQIRVTVASTLLVPPVSMKWSFLWARGCKNQGKQPRPALHRPDPHHPLRTAVGLDADTEISPSTTFGIPAAGPAPSCTPDPPPNTLLPQIHAPKRQAKPTALSI